MFDRRMEGACVQHVGVYVTMILIALRLDPYRPTLHITMVLSNRWERCSSVQRLPISYGHVPRLRPGWLRFDLSLERYHRRTPLACEFSRLSNMERPTEQGN